MEKPLILRVLLVTFSLAAGLLLFILPAAAAETLPKPVGAVNDFANIIPGTYRQEMNVLAREVLEKTGTAIVVATFPTIGDNDPRDFANRLYQAWGIGKKGEDKGVLIFLALKERRIRIETGYGVEGILPDGLVGEILDRDVRPFLKKGEYGQGLLNAMAALSSVIARDAKVSLEGGSGPAREMKPGAAPREERGIPLTSGLTWLLLLILVAIPLLGTRQGRDLLPFILGMIIGGMGRGGGGFGGFGGGGFGGFGGGGSGGGGADRGF
jgi:uncharacterized protein